jgi:hypothetical protein
MAYNMFRIAAILQGIAKRVEAGTASSAQAANRPRAPATGQMAWNLPATPETLFIRREPLTWRTHGFRLFPQNQRPARTLAEFMDEHIYPAEGAYNAEIEANTAAGKRWTACRPLKTSSPRPRPPGCGTCSCRSTALQHRVMTVRA